MYDLKSVIDTPGAILKDVTEHIGKLTHAGRISQIIELGKKQQMRLWDIAEGGPALDLDYLIPKDARPLEPFPFEGKNSLPLFTRFRKVFYRTEEGTIAGYNDQPLSPLTGPGYYVVHMSDFKASEIAIDYLKIPSSHPRGWPEIRPNEQGLSRFIYGGMIDYLRYVSDDIVIGRAFKAGKTPMPNWFILCRANPRK